MPALVSLLDRCLARLQPDELYLPYPSIHQDHVAGYEAGMRSARLSMHAEHWFPPRVLVYDVSAYDLELHPTGLRWNTFEELTPDQALAKAEAIACYSSQMVEGPHPVNGIMTTAAALGGSRRVAFAEQYSLIRWVR